MGHWTNSLQQILNAASGAVTIVDFDQAIVPGSQTALRDGVYDYSYHVNLIKPSGEVGPSRIKGLLAVRREAGGTDRLNETQDFAYIDSGTEASVSHAGRVLLSAGDEVQIRVNMENPEQSGVLMTAIRPRRSSLTLDLIGASASGNFADSTFPTVGMASGQPFYRTDLNEQFRFTGSKWLGEIRADGGGRNGTQVAGTYFRRFDRQDMAADRGIYIQYDATIVGVSWTKGNGAAGNIEVQRDGVAVASVDAGATAGGVDLDVDVAGSAVLSLFWDSVNDTNNVQITLHYRRRG